MNAKLTLSVPKALANKGKLVAKARNTSLSELVSHFIENLDANSSKATMDPRVASMYGAYKLPPGVDLDSLRFDSLVKKHLK